MPKSLTRLAGRLSEAAELRLLLPSLKARALANGLFAEEFNPATAKVRRFDDLRNRLTLVAANYQERARYWDDLGLWARARDHHLQAALWSSTARLVVKVEPDKADLFRMCRTNYALAAPYFSMPAEPVEIPYRVSSLNGYLRLPQQEPIAPTPVVVLFNALKSSKEELHYTEQAFLRQGIATLSFDYPAHDDNKTLDVDSLANALMMFIGNAKVLDASRIALYGISVGGAIALSLASRFNTAFKTCVSLSATTNFLSAQRSGFQHKVLSRLIEEDEDIYQIAQRFSPKSEIANVSCPTLIIGGGKDVFVSFAETKRLFESLTCQDKKLIVCSQAKHICFEMMPSLRYEIAQWVSERI